MKHTEETKLKIKENNAKHWLNKKLPFVVWNKGKKGYKVSPRSEEGKQHMREAWVKMKEKGIKPPTHNQPHSKEAKTKMSIARIGKMRGELSPHWKGGTSNDSYSYDWTKTLKRSIRERDNYVCRICCALQGDIALDVHHIDYNKENCSPENLITLCHSCHMKTNAKSKHTYWIDYFNKII